MKNRGLLDRLKNYVKVDRSIMNLYEGCKTMIKNKIKSKSIIEKMTYSHNDCRIIF